MIENVIQRKVPKRKDRFTLRQFAYVVMVATLISSRLVPEIEDVVLGNLFGIYIPLAIGLGFFEWRAWRTTWRKFAETSDLAYEEYKSKQAIIFKWPRVTGIYRQFPVKIEKFTRGTGRSRRTYTVINLTLKTNTKEVLEISGTSVFSSIKREILSKKQKLQYIQLGNEVLDKKLEIKSISEQFAKNTLSSFNLQQGLIEIRSQAPRMKIKIHGNKLSYEERSIIMDRKYLLALINTLVELAENVERHRR